jgi:hypothetical protein
MLFLLILAGAALFATGCNNPSGFNNGTAPPAGTQTLTFNTTAGSTAVKTMITVTIK